ncbi:MAG: hypothetical protein LBJ36_02010 [Synergistaceae bacterium]|nr:hypothetical protein [Synergistaceae bacterium]
MNYLSFAGWLLFATWILADSVPRFVLPRLHAIYDALEELASGGWGTGRWGSPLSLVIQVVLSGFLAYLLTIWSVWCVLRCFTYTRFPGTSGVLYFGVGFLCCEYALGKMARAGRYRGFFMSVFHYAMGMGAFVVFAMNPLPIKDFYSWLMRLMGVDF